MVVVRKILTAGLLLGGLAAAHWVGVKAGRQERDAPPAITIADAEPATSTPVAVGRPEPVVSAGECPVPTVAQSPAVPLPPPIKTLFGTPVVLQALKDEKNDKPEALRIAGLQTIQLPAQNDVVPACIAPPVSSLHVQQASVPAPPVPLDVTVPRLGVPVMPSGPLGVPPVSSNAGRSVEAVTVPKVDLPPPADKSIHVENPKVVFDYEITKKGASDIREIQLWVTVDNGMTWQEAATVKPGQPLRANLGKDGTYGARVLIISGSGVFSVAPKRGDKPDVTVVVDTVRPEGRLSGVRPDTAPQLFWSGEWFGGQ